MKNKTNLLFVDSPSSEYVASANFTIESVHRNPNIDMVKLVAMMCVVGLHAFMWGGDGVSMGLYATSVIAIPLFFIVSGYLLLGKNNVSNMYSFKKILSIWRYIFFTVVSYQMALSLGIMGLSNIRDGLVIGVLHSLNSVVQRGNFGVYWYFGTMMIIYMMYPFLVKLNNNRRVFLYCIGLLATVLMVVFLLNIMYGFEKRIPQPLRLWNWLFYFMLGGGLKWMDYTRVNVKKLIIILIASYLGYILPYLGMYFKGCLHTPYCEYWYSCPAVILYALSVFIVVMKLDLNRMPMLSRMVFVLTPVFLPVYSYHIFFIQFNRNWFESGPTLFVSTLVMSIIFGKILMSIPYLNKMYRI